MLADVTILSGKNRIEKERDSRYDTSTICFLLLLFDAAVLMLFLIAAAVQGCVLKLYSSHD